MVIKNYTGIPMPDPSTRSRRETLEYWHCKLLQLRDKYSDEIPKQIVHSTTPWYKCRKGWWNALLWEIDELKRLKVIQTRTYNKSKKVMDRYLNRVIERRKLVNPSHIKSANKVLDSAIADLEGIIAKES